MPAKRSSSKPKPVKKPSKEKQAAKKKTRKKASSTKVTGKKKASSGSKPRRPVKASSRKRKAAEDGQLIRKPTKKKKLDAVVASSSDRDSGNLIEVAKSTVNEKKNKTAKKTSKRKRIKVEEVDVAPIKIVKPALRKVGMKPRKMVSSDLKILSYNVNGIRSATKKGLLEFLRREDADILCFSETKCDEENNPITELEGYTTYWYDCTFKKGYSGTCVLSKTPALNVQKGHGVCDDQGRVITLEYPRFYLCHCYVPNSGEGKHIPNKGKKLKFEDRRKEWDIQMRKHLETLLSKKPLIWTGDLNVAIQDFDVFDGETNKNRPRGAGFTPYERANFGNLVNDLKLHDVYREFYPTEKSSHYTFWSMRSRARPVNKGWRLDYFVVTKEVLDAVKTIEVRKQFDENELVLSDHVPLVLCFDPTSL